jgi:3-hydroxyacyl-[acyl-carrier-protein] dehydratase
MSESETAGQGPVLDVHDILEALPHRYPFLLVDRVVSVEGDVLRGYKNVSFNEPFFQGHFPAEPVMPGVLIIEAMAQAAALLALHETGTSAKDRAIYFMSVDGVRFRRPVVPGDRLDLEATVVKKRSKIWVVETKATVEGQPVSEAKMMAMIAPKEGD